MHATTTIEVALDPSGRTVARQLQCEVPLLVRVADTTGPALTLLLVNGAAGPLGGDRLSFRLEVHAGATVVVRSVAAMLAQPGPTGEPSSLDVDVIVHDGATLDWAPEPMVSVRGSRHVTNTHLRAAATATVTMRETVSLGRHDEPPGTLQLCQRVTIDDIDVLRHHTEFAPGPLLGIGAHGPAKAMTSEVRIGPNLPPPAVSVGPDVTRAVFHLTPICALITTRTS